MKPKRLVSFYQEFYDPEILLRMILFLVLFSLLNVPRRHFRTLVRSDSVVMINKNKRKYPLFQVEVTAG